MGLYNQKYQCNVYQVKVVISQIGGCRPGKDNPEYTKEEKVLAISEEAAINKVKRALEWELRELLRNSNGWVINHETKLLLENVTY